MPERKNDLVRKYYFPGIQFDPGAFLKRGNALGIASDLLEINASTRI